MRAQITFKSGAQIEADIEDLTTSRHALTKELVKIVWDTPEDWTRKLHTVDVDEIVAIVLTRTSEEVLSDAAMEEAPLPAPPA